MLGVILGLADGALVGATVVRSTQSDMAVVIEVLRERCRRAGAAGVGEEKVTRYKFLPDGMSARLTLKLPTGLTGPEATRPFVEPYTQNVRSSGIPP
jgi:hypothetical protein